MISKMYGVYYLICDICGEAPDDAEFLDFYQSVKYRKDKGWKIGDIDNGWKDICPDCLATMVKEV